MVKRIGKTPNSYMITRRILQAIEPNLNYKFLPNNLIPFPESYYQDNNKIAEYKYNRVERSPIKYNPEYNVRYSIIEGCWLNESYHVNNNSNILGSFGKFLTESKLTIPINIASKINVEYYGCRLIDIFNTFSFTAKEDLPLTEMDIGPEYVKNYIEIENLGGGNYLEYHDNPHFHSPMNEYTRGHIILAKKTNNNVYHISAFIIPYNTGLYTPGYVIHNDSHLVGNWMVVYSKTDNYSTVLMRDKTNQLTTFNFE